MQTNLQLQLCGRSLGRLGTLVPPSVTAAEKPPSASTAKSNSDSLPHPHFIP